MLDNNNIAIKQRILELFVDYVCIFVYLIILLGVCLGIFFGVLGSIPTFEESHSQMIALFASVLPIALIFSILDYKKGSIGKRKAGLKLYFKNKKFSSSLIRNIIKFLPWQLAHIGVIHGMYSNFDLWAVAFASAGMVLAFIMLIMSFVRKDKRHLGDLLAGTQVQAMKIPV
ncbi:RDD family protein [Eubacteriales bacterium OttesenSCG-928-M02]|nr:RDD family protein [Eubacteriales bacterium OttesenSCG-928-M02]